MRVGVGMLLINDKVMKLLSNIIVIIVNYVFSKVFVFVNPRKNRDIDVAPAFGYNSKNYVKQGGLSHGAKKSGKLPAV